MCWIVRLTLVTTPIIRILDQLQDPQKEVINHMNQMSQSAHAHLLKRENNRCITVGTNLAGQIRQTNILAEQAGQISQLIEYLADVSVDVSKETPTGDKQAQNTSGRYPCMKLQYLHHLRHRRVDSHKMF